VHHDLSRRAFLGALAPLAVALTRIRSLGSDGRLTSRPGPVRGSVPGGLSSLGLAAPRDGAIYVPTGYAPDHPIGLILALHGATQSHQVMLRFLLDSAERHGYALLAPDSRDVTWDLVRGGFGPDEAFLDRALGWTFDRCAVDPARVVIAGFSDGATAALSLGLINGDLFRHIIAFSPGFVVGDERHGKPAIFISHGTRDQILPIDRTSRRIVPLLRRAGYTVDLREFDGPHTVPPGMAEAAMSWLE
jgi:phospholipase/carboxylesterase